MIDESLAADRLGRGAPTTWVLSNHDVVRHTTRYGGGAQGLRRARAAALLMLALPGSVYLYQGEELGLPEVTDLPERGAPGPRVLPCHRGTGGPGRAAATAAGCRSRGRAEGPSYGFGARRQLAAAARRAGGGLSVAGADRRPALDAGAVPLGAARCAGACRAWATARWSGCGTRGVPRSRAAGASTPGSAVEMTVPVAARLNTASDGESNCPYAGTRLRALPSDGPWHRRPGGATSAGYSG